MSNLAIKFKNAISQSARRAGSTRSAVTPVCLSTCAINANSSCGKSSVITSNSKCIKYIKKQWNKFISFLSKKMDSSIASKTVTKEGLNAIRLRDDNVSKILENTISNKPYRIATAGYSFNTEGYEEITKTFLESVDRSLGSKNTGYVFPPSLDKGSIYDITSQISGLKKDKSLFFTAEDFYGEFLDPAKFSPAVNMKEYVKKPIYVFSNPKTYINATANASNVLVCTGGRRIAVSEIVEAIKRKNKVVLLVNLNLKNGTYNAVNEVENATRFFDEMRLSNKLKCSAAERRELARLLKDRRKINELVRVYLVNDSKSAMKAGERAAKFIKSAEPQIATNTVLPSISEVKTMSVPQLQELAKMKGGLSLMQKAGVIIPKPDVLISRNVYGHIKHSQIKTSDGQIIASSLIVSDKGGNTTNILKNISQKILQSPAKEHIHQIKWSTINPEVGIRVTQNQSKPITVRKIVTEGTLENCLVANNSHNIPLKYDVVKGTQYIDTQAGRQALTGDGFMGIYPSKKGYSKNVGQITEDRSFIPANIASKQYEIITKSGKRIPCNYEEMVSGVDYNIAKKGEVELKMAVPPTEVISSEGEILRANKLYMVDSMGHFYDGNPIMRIKCGDINWNADMNDPVQARIRNLIDESLRLEAEADAKQRMGNNGLCKQLLQTSKDVTIRAEKEMTEWVQSIQNKNNVCFYI